MRNRVRCLLALVWVFAAIPASDVQAQVPLPDASRPSVADTIAAQLSSGDPKAIAWGAYVAGEHRIQEAVPELVSTLSSPQLQERGVEWGGARDAVLDALIRLDGRPPVDVLLRYYEERPEQVLILLSEPRPERDKALLNLIKGASGIRWYAMAGLLLEQKARGLAAELLRGLRLTIQVTVVDGKPQVGPGYGSGFGGGIGCGVLYPAAGFPAIATYSLWDSAGRGGIVLAEGPRPIYYTRKASPADWIPSSGHRILVEGPDAKDRLNYLEKLVEHWLPVEAVEEITLNWTTSRRFRQQVLAHRERIVAKYRDMLRLAQNAGALTADEAEGLSPSIEVRLEDQRRNKKTPLPHVSP